MCDLSAIHHRRSIRLQGYDYSQAGAYFVTLVSWQSENIFGEIVGDEMILKHTGEIIAEEWLRTPFIRPNIELDEFIIMPNHVHAVLVILPDIPLLPEGAMRRRAMRRIAPTTPGDTPSNQTNPPINFYHPNGAAPGSIGAILGQIKSITTKRINRIRTTPSAQVWQRNYYEHIIRNVEELDRIQAHTIANPFRWGEDTENLAGKLLA